MLMALEDEAAPNLIIRSGKFVYHHFDDEDYPFVVFCSEKSCVHWVGNPEAFPHWSEDLPVKLGLLRCTVCGAPVLRARDADLEEPDVRAPEEPDRV
ncbi:MAG: hypothetical protein AMXMBFR33_18650 [Candidatus Xenobia bacterium]